MDAIRALSLRRDLDGHELLDAIRELGITGAVTIEFLHGVPKQYYAVTKPQRQPLAAEKDATPSKPRAEDLTAATP